LREQEIARCENIIGLRTEAVLAKIAPAPGNVYATETAARPEWVLTGAAACAA